MNIDFSIVQKMNGLVGIYPWFDSLAIFITRYLIFIMGFSLFIFWFLKPRVIYRMSFVVALISSFFSYFILVPVIRYFYHRPRPYLIYGFKHLIDNISWSFPSNHATLAFCFATSVYLYNKKLGIIFYIAATLIAVSRIYVGVHWPTDILAGAFVGIIIPILTKRLANKLVASF